MSDPRERLTRLVELATENAPEKRRVLATELCDLLLDWPANYPHAMREPFETLLEKTMRLIDRETRLALIERIASAQDAPLAFLSEYFFDAPHALRTAILARGAQADVPGVHGHRIDETALIGLARTTPRDALNDALATALEVSPETAARILHDGSAQALAVAAKGAHLSRAAFSTLALLAGGTSEILTRLAAYDGVPQDGAENLLAFWRARCASGDRQAA